jgi:dihydropteroate synthase
MINFVRSKFRLMQNLKPKDTFFSKNFSLNIRGKLLDLSIPRVMGILNLSQDSFYDGGKYSTKAEIKSRVEQIVNEGADIIDIGGVSTRPGAKLISFKEEFKRLVPAIEIIRKSYPDFPVSIDTFSPDIAEKMISEFEADIINDITAGGDTGKMFEIIAEHNIPYIIMHMKGLPLNMQINPEYKDVVDDILVFIAEKTYRLKALGVNDIIIDPGFGFGKSIDHNYQLLSFLECFRSLELPIMVGLSRKSMIYRLLSLDPEQSLNGTTALNMFALIKGANILRVHDVKEAVEVCKLFSKLSNIYEQSQIK